MLHMHDALTAMRRTEAQLAWVEVNTLPLAQVTQEQIALAKANHARSVAGLIEMLNMDGCPGSRGT